MDLNRPLMDQKSSHTDRNRPLLSSSGPKEISYMDRKRPLMDLRRSPVDLNRRRMELMMSHLDLKKVGNGPK